MTERPVSGRDLQIIVYGAIWRIGLVLSLLSSQAYAMWGLD